MKESKKLTSDRQADEYVNSRGFRLFCFDTCWFYMLNCFQIEYALRVLLLSLDNNKLNSNWNELIEMN